MNIYEVILFKIMFSFAAAQSQVRCMTCHGGHLFIATTVGSLFVLHAETLAPVSVVYGHIEDIGVLLPMVVPNSTSVDYDSTSIGSSGIKTFAIFS